MFGYGLFERLSRLGVVRRAFCYLLLDCDVYVYIHTVHRISGELHVILYFLEKGRNSMA